MIQSALLSKVDLKVKKVLGDKTFCSARIHDFIQVQGDLYP